MKTRQRLPVLAYCSTCQQTHHMNFACAKGTFVRICLRCLERALAQVNGTELVAG